MSGPHNAKWDLDNPRHVEAAFAYFYSLPDDEMISDQESDDDAQEEMHVLDCTSTSTSTSVSSEVSQTNICVTPMPEHELTEILDNSSEICLPDPPPPDEAHSEDEPIQCLSWGHGTENIDNNAEVHFIERPESLFEFPHQCKEIEYFNKIFSDEILQLIVDQTNLYASQGPEPAKSWTDTSVEEIKALIGVIIMMGIHSLPHLANYWSSDPFLTVPGIAQVMSSKRYKKIIENIHLNDNNTAVQKGQPGYDKLHKVRPLIEKLNESFTSAYKHSSFLAVDESMIPFKGRSSIKQYMPLKPIKRGYKVWCLADSLTGYIQKFDIYTGKSDVIDNNQGLGEKVVLKLTSSLKEKNVLLHLTIFLPLWV